MELPLAEYQAQSPKFGPDLFERIGVEGALADKDVVGGTAPARVRAEIERLKWEFPPLESGTGTGTETTR